LKFNFNYVYSVFYILPLLLAAYLPRKIQSIGSIISPILLSILVSFPLFTFCYFTDWMETIGYRMSTVVAFAVQIILCFVLLIIFNSKKEKIITALTLVILLFFLAILFYVSILGNNAF